MRECTVRMLLGYVIATRQDTARMRIYRIPSRNHLSAQRVQDGSNITVNYDCCNFYCMYLLLSVNLSDCKTNSVSFSQGRAQNESV